MATLMTRMELLKEIKLSYFWYQIKEE